MDIKPFCLVYLNDLPENNQSRLNYVGDKNDKVMIYIYCMILLWLFNFRLISPKLYLQILVSVINSRMYPFRNGRDGHREFDGWVTVHNDKNFQRSKVYWNGCFLLQASWYSS